MNLTNTINPKLVIKSHIIVNNIKVPVKTEIDFEWIDEWLHSLIWKLADSNFNKDIIVHVNI